MAKRHAGLTATLLGVLVASATAGTASAPSSRRSDKACSLLTRAELEAALGAAGGAPLAGLEIPFVKDAAHDHAGSLFSCQGKAAGRFVSVTFGDRPVTPEGRTRADEKVVRSEDALRKKGYAIKVEEVGGVRCWTISAPPADTSPSAIFSTTCSGTRGAEFYSITVSASGAADLVPIATLRGLAAKAAARLP